MPFIAGNESAGDVVAVGPGVTDVKVGDRVAFVGPLGGYAVERVVPADRAVKLPDNISYEQAAGMMLKGMAFHTGSSAMSILPIQTPTPR